MHYTSQSLHCCDFRGEFRRYKLPSAIEFREATSFSTAWPQESIRGTLVVRWGGCAEYS